MVWFIKHDQFGKKKKKRSHCYGKNKAWKEQRSPVHLGGGKVQQILKVISYRSPDYCLYTKNLFKSGTSSSLKLNHRVECLTAKAQHWEPGLWVVVSPSWADPLWFWSKKCNAPKHKQNYTENRIHEAGKKIKPQFPRGIKLKNS